jgi:hypothetical protein
LRRALSVALAVAALAACSKTSQQPPILTPDSGTGGPPVTTGAAGSMVNTRVDAGPKSGDVLISIMSPAAPGPMGPTIQPVTAPVDVAAKITISMDGSDLVDPSSVRMTLTQEGSATIVPSVPLTGPSADSVYKGKLALEGLDSGEYTITVTAKSTTGTVGTASVKIRVDAGPVIDVISPVSAGHYKTSLFVQVVVDDGGFGPITANELSASIGGQPVPLTPVPTAPGQFRGTFDLEKPTPMRGDQLFVISAVNSRGTRTELRYVIVVDIVGPEITNTKPGPGEIVGRVIKLSANIKDGAGLNDSSIQVLIGDKTTPIFRLAPKNEIGTNVYSELFDTRNLPGCGAPSLGTCIVRPTISFRAADLLGNETTVSYEIAVDNTPPIADLVPPPIRAWKYDNGVRCSHAFDPLSRNWFIGDAPDDGCVVGQMFDLRARIQDGHNFATGLKQGPISGVDPERTAAYILDTTVLNGEPQPLVVDTDGDGACDAINPKLEPTTSPIQGPRQVLKVRLAPVTPAGAADFTDDPTLPITLAGGGTCRAGDEVDPPFDLCPLGPQPSLAISYAGGVPAIWAAEPVTIQDEAFCFGSQLDTKANNIVAVKKSNPPLLAPAGWKCIAIATADMNGNTSTSAPIRVYLDDYDLGGQTSDVFCPNRPATTPNAFPTIPAGAGNPPSCTGTYDKVTGVVSQKACTTRNFKLPPGNIELCRLGDCGTQQPPPP